MLAINSSPHKGEGNTALILTPFLEGLREAGATVELYYTSDLKIGPCLGDHACQLRTPGTCIQSDDMQWLLPKIGEADIWVWATPVYDDGVTGPLKVLMDRMVPGARFSVELRGGRLRHPPLREGKPKKLVLVSNSGFPEPETFDPLVAHLRAFCANANAEYAGALLRPAGPLLKPMLEKGAPVRDIFEAARDAGRQLARDGQMAEATLNAVSRPIITGEAFLQLVNQRVQAMAALAGQETSARAKPAVAAKPPAPVPISASAKEPSRLAERVAIIRAGESRKPEGERICYDPYAIRFVHPAFLQFASRYPDIFADGTTGGERRLPGVSNMIAARVRYFDDAVKAALACDLEQLVILGAGYDTRAYRLAGLAKVRVFEVDQPAIVEQKTARVREIFGSLPGHVTYVAVDFDREDFGRQLMKSGYDRSKKALFLLEGLLYYLTPEAVDTTLASIAGNSAKGSAVIFDYYPQSVVDGTCELQGAKATRDHAASLGEPLKFGIGGPVEQFLASRGFTKVRNVTSEDLRKLYFTGPNAARELCCIYSFAYGEV